MVLTVVSACDSRRPNASQPVSVAGKPLVQTVTEGDVTLRLSVSSEHVRVGDPVALRLTLDAPADVQSVEPPSFEEIEDRFAVRRRESSGPLPHGNGRRWEFAVVIAPDGPDQDDGRTELPPLTLRFQRGATSQPSDATDAVSPASAPESTTIATKSCAISVVDPGPFDPAAMPRTPLDVHLPYDIGWSAVWIAGAVALAVAAWWWWRRRARREPASAAPVVPPHDWALRELHRLAVEKLPEQDRSQEYYFRLSAIVREYIERRFGLHAPERTTEEFLREMQDHPLLTVDHQSGLREFLAACDQVKFARYAPDAGECRQGMATARDFVDATTDGAIPAAPSVVSEAA